MKKILLSPLFAPIMALLFVSVFGALALCLYDGKQEAFFADNGLCDKITYCVYGIALFVSLYFWRDFLAHRKDFFAFEFLLIVAVLREAGIQHWLTSTDTTAIKIRFFTNPNNPLFEKIRAGVLLLLLVCVVCFLLIKYFLKIWKGFWKQETIYWTIATLGSCGIICKIADRFPSHYVKLTHTHLNDLTFYSFKIVEEGFEIAIVLSFIIAFIQYHFLHQQKQSSDS